MSGLEFLDRLQASGVIDAAAADRIRAKLLKPGKPISAERLAKYLVEKGELTASQAAKALKSAGGGKRPGAADPLALGDAEIVELDEVLDLGNIGSPTDFAPLGSPTAAPTAGPKQPKAAEVNKSFRAKQQLSNRWESKWMIVGPTLVLLLAGTAVGLWFVLTRTSAEKMFEAGEAAYRNQSYAASIGEYEKFLKSYPRDPKATLAKVRIGIATIRGYTESSQWQKALEVLPNVLPAIENEEAFPDEGRPELTSLLPAIAGGFVTQAERSADVTLKDQLVAQTLEAMKFVDNAMYLPTSARRQVETTLTSIRERLAIVEREIARERKLVSTIAEMDAAVAADQTSKSFELRKTLLREFPILESDPRLMEAAKRTAEHERGLVRAETRTVAATSDERVVDAIGSVTLASLAGRSIPALAGEIHPVLVRGAVYMIDVSTGQVLWRRFVGYETQVTPIWVNERGGDVILADQRLHEILRVEGRTGRLIWRATIGEPFGPPTVSAAGVFVATRSGRLLQLALDAEGDLPGGRAVDGVSFPQQLAIGPATDRTGQYVYQVGLQSNLYVLEPGDAATPMVCREVYYLAHRTGSVTIPPVLVQGLLFVVENSGSDYSVLHILKSSQRGLGLEPAQTPIRMRGEVLVAAELYGPQGVLLLTDLGEVSLLRVDTTLVEDGEDPVQIVAKFDRQTPEGTYSVFLADKGKLWVGDDGVSSFTVQAQRGTIDRSNSFFAGHRFVAPFALYGDTLVQTRIRPGSRLVSVAAVDAATQSEIWRTDFAAPLAGAPLVEIDGTAVAITSQGDQYVLDRNLLESGVSFEPRRRGSNTEQDLVFDTLIDFGGGRALCFGPPEKRRVLGIDPAESVNTAPLSDSDVPAGTLAFPPVRFGDRALAASTQGPVLLLDPLRAKIQGTPFQPATGPESKIAWVAPAILDDERFVIADGESNVYLVTRTAGGLSKTAESALPGPARTPMAARQGAVYVGVDAQGESTLVVLDGTTLEVRASQPAPSGIAFGPRTVGDLVLVGTSDSQVQAVGEDATALWTVNLETGFVVGAAAVGDGRVALAISDGRVMLVDATGTASATWNAGEPLGGNPAFIGGQWLIPAYDGTLLILPQP